jgi:hypothetical protein
MASELPALRNFLNLIEAKIDITEPAVMEDDCAVVRLAPAKGGLVGLDADTGRPMRVGWRYPTINEKPVIINMGNKQTVIKPPPPPPPSPPQLPETASEVVDLYNDMLTASTAPEEPVVEPGWPEPPRTRFRLVDT